MCFYISIECTITTHGDSKLWDGEVNTTTKIKHNRPDIVINMPGENKWQLIDTAIPKDNNIVSKRNEKVNKYIELASVIRT